jgi:hypothetical protein
LHHSRLITALKKRRNKNDKFRDLYGYSWDYLIVFKVYDENEAITEIQREYNMKYVLGQLSKGGLEIRLFYGVQVI